MTHLQFGAALLVACVGLATAAGADEIVMQSGKVTEGIIVEETDTLIRVRTDLGVTGIGREFIAEIRRGSPEANAALEARWHREATEKAAERKARRAGREAKAAAARAHADAQRAKGLVLYDGEWLPQAEVKLHLQRERQEQVAANNRRIATLKEEADAAEQRAKAASVRTEGLENEIAQLTELLHERHAHIEALEDDLALCQYNLRAVSLRYRP